ncbi:MAG: hypothetical protein ACFFDN_20890 [Candidatus Hodarchaeota archaeon]
MILECEIGKAELICDKKYDLEYDWDKVIKILLDFMDEIEQITNNKDLIIALKRGMKLIIVNNFIKSEKQQRSIISKIANLSIVSFLKKVKEDYPTVVNKYWKIRLINKY